MDTITALPILVVTIPVEGGEPGEVEHTAECPHCKEQGADIVREIDTAVRWNTGALEFKDGQIVGAWWATGDGDFQHTRYECDYCGKPVTLPKDIAEDWS